MTRLHVHASFDAEDIEVHSYFREDGTRWAGIELGPPLNPAKLVLAVRGLDQVAELEAALATVREHLSNPTAARDAA